MVCHPDYYRGRDLDRFDSGGGPGRIDVDAFCVDGPKDWDWRRRCPVGDRFSSWMQRDFPDPSDCSFPVCCIFRNSTGIQKSGEKCMYFMDAFLAHWSFGRLGDKSKLVNFVRYFCVSYLKLKCRQQAESNFGMKMIARKMNRGLKGYMTVEAALIIPMVLCIIVILIYTSFFLYDRCLFAQDSYLLCLREAYRKEEGAPKVDADRLAAGAEKQFGTKYFAVDSFSGDASVKGKYGFYEGTAKVAPKVFGTYFLMPKTIWNQCFSSASRKNDPPWYIRSYRRKSYFIKKGIQVLQNDEE